MSDPLPIEETERASGAAGPRIGLCLSGGGFRAAFFHLGTVRYLEEIGIMERVEAISTVSGGSIVGAYYLVEMERRLRAQPDLDRLAACDEIIQAFAAEVGRNLRMRALVFRPFFHPVLTMLELLRLRHPGDTMAKAFERRFFPPRLPLGALPVSSSSCRAPRALINTTSVVSGLRVVFSRESDTGLASQIEKSDVNELPLARVVGASAAVPGLFRPLRIGNDVLADGGVVDNQGIESLFDYFEFSEEAMNRLPPGSRQTAADRESGRSIVLIVSDAAGQLSVETAGRATRRNSAVRSLAILQAENRRKTLKLLLDAHRDGHVGAFAFTHLAMNVKGSACDDVPGQRLPSELITPTAQVRTDLDDFSVVERDALVFHGYTLMKNRVRRYGSGLIEGVDARDAGTNAAWQPNSIALADSTRSGAQCARKSRQRLEAFLNAGRHRLFRDLRRFPWQLGPIAAAFAAAGWTSAYGLRSVPLPFLGVSAQESLRDAIMAIVAALIPAYDLALVDLRFLENAFGTTDGEFAGAVNLAAALACLGLSFYAAMFGYWGVKRLFRLPERMERRMLARLEALRDDGHRPA